MDNNVVVKAILLMGGEGKRFGSALPKQFHRLSGKKVYLHTLEAFLKIPDFAEILLVTHPDWIEEVEGDLSHYPDSKLRIVQGGTTRQVSSYKGLLACEDKTDIVVIHDAVRPFVSEEILLKNIDAAIRFHAVDTCIPSPDTIVHSLTPGQIHKIPNRSEFLRGQTPQSFSYPLIFDAHKKAIERKIENASDDCQLVLASGRKVVIVQGEECNLKITSELDLFLAEQLLRSSKNEDKDARKNSLEGKRFAVTGGTGGIGKEICALLEKEGAIAFPISRNSPHFPVDLSSPKDALNLFLKIGALDGLINSLGYLKVKSLQALTSFEIDEMLNNNLKGVIFSCKYAHLHPKGHIINIASSSFFRGRGEIAIYSSAKAGVVNFTQALAEERSDLYINAIIPQRTNTPMRRSNFPLEEVHSLLTPQEVAVQVIDLLKREVTGMIVEVKKPR
jgi:2-C-methyl-D-erythritol 4-phosphate cytidylyltransferase